MKANLATDANPHRCPDQLIYVIWCHQDTSYVMDMGSLTSLWKLTQMRMGTLCLCRLSCSSSYTGSLLGIHLYGTPIS